MKLSNIILSGALLTALAAAAPAMAATNLLVNGDFESDTYGSNPGYYNVGQDHGAPSGFGWTVSNGNVDIVNNGAYGPNLATGGGFNLDLVGYGSTGQISQTITTVAGQSYNVSFDYSSNNGINDPTAEVLAGGNVIGNVTGKHSWKTFTGAFTATGPTTTFAINETIGGGNAGVFLDNVSLSAAPEPAAWALMMIGVGGMGAALRSRRKAVAA